MDSGRDCLQAGRNSSQVLRVANKEQTRWRKIAEDSADHLYFGLLVKVDQHISAEDEIEGTQDGIGIGVQIDAGESHDPVQLGTDLHHTFVFAPAFEHISAEVFGGDLLRFFDRVNCRSRLFEYTSGNVRCKNFKIPTFALGKMLQQKHGKGIRLLTGGATGTPD